ncbi:hypothetical protein [Phycisphaera mikurensis]|uniref:Uncharacterized protein n=1 Tax=Phycisphaera mikurensis (strain NBRC 102666 / KCTC 22515 / FYK2301M01) TaxID=1142394 RepID=I0IDU2_PHYMF|nr:hypothetical protein [Phycisphaera mikurensis]MBB6441241.1 hypothetical protein [Phycisphaera mikurensis]BAM03430.1 hypothetical protein PSMK_12710 [Phycisphaera mikurensis NBRC 102666]
MSHPTSNVKSPGVEPVSESFGPAQVHAVVCGILRFDKRYARLADRIADAVSQRWSGLKRPPRGQFPREWVASTLCWWLRECHRRPGSRAGGSGSGFSRPLSGPIAGMLRPYRLGGGVGPGCVLTAALHRRAA